MDNVPVSVDEAGTNSTVSKDGGQFVFEFPEKKAGEIVHVRINKEGYVVVNDVQLEVTLPLNPDAKPLTIILCPEDEREKWAGQLYRAIIDKSTEEKYQQKLKALEEKYQADEAKLAAEKAALQKERDQLIATAQNTAEQLAKNQPGQNTELYKQAKRLFLDGKIEEAIKLLGDSDEKRRESVAQAKQAIEQQKQLIDNAVQEWLLKAQLLTIQFDFDGAQEAYKAAIDAAPDDFKVNFAYANFSQGLNRFEKARVAYGRCLEWARKEGKDSEVATTLNNLAILDSHQGRVEEARKEFTEALQIRRELAQKNPETYQPGVAQTLNNLGILDREQGRMEEARKESTEALQIRRELAQKNPETYQPDVAMTLNNLAILDSHQGRVEKARKEFTEALQIRRELAQKNPETYQPYVADMLNNLGILDVLDRDQGRVEEARKEFTEALQIYRELAQKNPETYQPYVPTTLNNLGILDSDQGRLEEARKEFTEALQIRRELVLKNPETYQPDVAHILKNLGVLDRDQGRLEEARKEYVEALEIYKSFAQKNPERFTPEVTKMKSLLAELPK